MELRSVPDSHHVRLREELGLHQWTVSVVYCVQDPAAELVLIEQRMLLDVGPVRCVHCSVRYRTDLRHQRCSFSPVRTDPDGPTPSA